VKPLELNSQLQAFCAHTTLVKQFLVLDQFIPLPQPSPIWVLFLRMRGIIGLPILRVNKTELAIGSMEFLVSVKDEKKSAKGQDFYNLNIGFLFQFPRLPLIHQGQTWLALARKEPTPSEEVKIEYIDDHIVILGTKHAILLLRNGLPEQWVCRDSYYGKNKGAVAKENSPGPPQIFSL
jgi:hypothetical protein